MLMLLCLAIRHSAVNDAPYGTLTGASLGVNLRNTDFTFTRANLLSGIHDVETPDSGLVVSGVTATPSGTLSLSGSTWTYMPPHDFTGTVTISFSVTDTAVGGPANTVAASKTITVYSFLSEYWMGGKCAMPRYRSCCMRWHLGGASVITACMVALAAALMS